MPEGGYSRNPKVINGLQVDSFVPINSNDNESVNKGAPKSEAESIFLSTPELSNAANFIVTYKKTENKLIKKELVRQMAQEFLHDPRHLTAFFDAVELLQELESYQAKKLKKEVEQALSEATFHTLPNKTIDRAEEMRRWITIYAESKVYQNIAEQVLRKLLEQCKNEADVVDVCYSMAMGGLRDSNPMVVRKTLQILGHLAPVMGPGTKAGLLFELAKHSPDPATFALARDIDSAINLLRDRFEGYKEKIDNAVQRIQTHKSFIQGGLKIAKEHPAWAAQISRAAKAMKNRNFRDPTNPMRIKLAEAITRGDYSGLTEANLKQAGLDENSIKLMMEEMGVKSFEDFTVADAEATMSMTDSFMNAGPLRQWLNDVSAEERNKKGEKVTSVHLPEFHPILPTNYQAINDLIGQRLKGNALNNKVIDDEQYWQTLGLYLPDQLIDRQKAEPMLKKLEQYNNQLVEEMRADSVHLLSPRGDIIIIEDPLLTKMGFTGIAFFMDERNRRDTEVYIKIGNYTYRAELDEYFSLRDSLNIEKSINLPKDGEFLRNVILSHLHAIRCTDLVTDISEDETIEGGRVFNGRRAHRRILPEGQNPTREQILLILEKYHVDIVRMNRERDAEAAAAGRENKRKLTYVSESKAQESQKPIHSIAPRATNYLNQILAGKIPVV